MQKRMASETSRYISTVFLKVFNLMNYRLKFLHKAQVQYTRPIKGRLKCFFLICKKVEHSNNLIPIMK